MLGRDWGVDMSGVCEVRVCYGAWRERSPRQGDGETMRQGKLAGRGLFCGRAPLIRPPRADARLVQIVALVAERYRLGIVPLLQIIQRAARPPRHRVYYMRVNLRRLDTTVAQGLLDRA